MTVTPRMYSENGHVTYPLIKPGPGTLRIFFSHLQYSLSFHSFLQYKAYVKVIVYFLALDIHLELLSLLRIQYSVILMTKLFFITIVVHSTIGGSKIRLVYQDR